MIFISQIHTTIFGVVCDFTKKTLTVINPPTSSHTISTYFKTKIQYFYFWYRNYISKIKVKLTIGNDYILPQAYETSSKKGLYILAVNFISYSLLNGI